MDKTSVRYERHKEAMRNRSAELSTAGRDVAHWVHDDVNPARKEACRYNLALFLQTYLPVTFCKPFSDDHIVVIKRVELAVLQGGQFEDIVYRGFGKTAIGEASCLWAALYGHRTFIVLIGASGELSKSNLDSIKSELENNDLLDEDFSLIVGPIRGLEGEGRRCRGQLYNGTRTNIIWKDNRIVLPDIDGSPAAGTVVLTRGITAGLRGIKHKRADGAAVRPDYVYIDDPQTDESARSASQIATRMSIIKKGILNLRGHNKRLALILAGTIIEVDDLVDQLSDHTKNPSWQAERIPMVRKWSDAHDTFWMKDYYKARTEYDPTVVGAQAEAHVVATKLYESNRVKADAGCIVSWQYCYDETELSAVQHAYNMLIDLGESAFASECQNEPKKITADSELMTASQVAAKTNGYARGVIPNDYTIITSGIDVHDNILYWSVWGWRAGFSGSCIDYGTYPDQKRDYFNQRNVKSTLSKASPGSGRVGAIVDGLVKLMQILSTRQFRRIDGTVMQIAKGLVDRGHEPDAVEQALMKVGLTGTWMAARGRGITASMKSMDEYDRTLGQVGWHWYIPHASVKTKNLRYVQSDVNFWKTWLHKGLSTSIGDPGALTLFGKSPSDHRLFADHIIGEHRIWTTGQGRGQWEWKQYTDRRDNHWLDCSVEAAIAANMAGITPEGVAEKPKRKKIKLSDIQRQRRGF